ncbi:hypothetical protein RRG08_048376 [Elysia crispata]|uniref:Uncharacterized protein n=1 Tax=Elysia crispata TaxID=231223 RepID=A0AAE1B8K4_9GAST|nr:hypothetical protein RRG08_048376 [Elysia crispata]
MTNICHHCLDPFTRVYVPRNAHIIDKKSHKERGLLMELGMKCWGGGEEGSPGIPYQDQECSGPESSKDLTDGRAQARELGPVGNALTLLVLCSSSCNSHCCPQQLVLQQSLLSPAARLATVTVVPSSSSCNSHCCPQQLVLQQSLFSPVARLATVTVVPSSSSCNSHCCPQ